MKKLVYHLTCVCVSGLALLGLGLAYAAWF